MFQFMAHLLLCSVFLPSPYFFFLSICYCSRSPLLTSAFILCLCSSLYLTNLCTFFNSLSFTPSVLTSFVYDNLSPPRIHLRRSQSPMSCWLGSLVTRRPSAQWLPSSHADANFTVQLDCASLCHHPGGRVHGMLGRVIPPACASSAVSLVGSILKLIKRQELCLLFLWNNDFLNYFKCSGYTYYTKWAVKVCV